MEAYASCISAKVKCTSKSGDVSLCLSKNEMCTCLVVLETFVLDLSQCVAVEVG